MISPGVLPDINQGGWRTWWDYVNYPLNDSYLGATAGTGAHMTYSYSSTWGRTTFVSTSASYSSNIADLLNLPFSLLVGKPYSGKTHLIKEFL